MHPLLFYIHWLTCVFYAGLDADQLGWPGLELESSTKDLHLCTKFSKFDKTQEQSHKLGNNGGVVGIEFHLTSGGKKPGKVILCSSNFILKVLERTYKKSEHTV